MKRKIAPLFMLIAILSLVLCACSEASSLSFAYESMTVKAEETFFPEIKIFPKKAEYTLSVDNETIAIVENGAIKTLKTGKTIIRVKSGKRSAECVLYVVSGNEWIPTDPIVTTKHTVSFQISNYAEYGLQTGTLDSVTAIDGSFLNVNEPNIHGYVVDCWYVDKECSKKFDMSTPIVSDMILYGKISPREQGYNIINGLVVGLLYKNLPHEKIDLPEKTAGGETIIGIADEAFYNDKELKEVTIPACYKTIGNSAFAGCEALEKVVFSADSELEEIGINAFGVERENGNIVSSCEKLNFEKLPDSVTKVGDFAFYKCSSLALDGIPSGLDSVSMYAFSGTLINNVDFVNVTKIFEGGFFECSALDSVRGTENVVKCAKYAFDKTKLKSDANKEYNENRTEVGCYADTILFGVIDNFGTGIGNGKYRIKESATLIADNAFDGDKQTELTLYIDTPAAKAALDNNISFIGENVFRKVGNGYPTGVFIVVGEGLSDRYKEKYSAGSDDYSELFAEEETVDVRGEDNADVVNWGKHVLLLRGEAYYYDRYVPYGEGAYTVKIGNLQTQKPYPVVRVNMNSFVGVKNMKTLELKGVKLIAYMAVVNCVNLNAVDLTHNTVSLTMPEHATALPAGVEIRVANGSYLTYRQRWADNGFNTLCNQLKAVGA